MAASSSDQILQQLEGSYSKVTQLGLVKPGTGVDVQRLETWLQEIEAMYVTSTYDSKEPTLEGASFKKSYNESTGLQGVENILKTTKHFKESNIRRTSLYSCHGETGPLRMLRKTFLHPCNKLSRVFLLPWTLIIGLPSLIWLH